MSTSRRLLPFTVVTAFGVFTGIYIFKGEFQELEKEKQEYHVDSVAQLPADPSAGKFSALHQSPSPSFETLRNGPEAGLAAAKSEDNTNTETSSSKNTTRRSIWDYLQPGDARNKSSSSAEKSP